MSPVLVGVLLYVLAQLVIGMLVSRRIATEEDYFVAGRRFGIVFASASIFATWFGAETCVGAAGQIYSKGLGRTSVEPFAYGVCLLILGLVFAAPFWRSRIITLADLLRARYSAGVERFAALLLIPTSVLWAAAQVRAFGQVLASAGRFEVETGLAVAAFVVIAYTAAGGLMADVVTDLVQAIALFVGLAVVLVAVVGELGGASSAWDAALAAREHTAGVVDSSWLDTIEAWALPICGSVVAQEAVSRCVAAKSPQVARRSALLGGGLYLAVGLIPVFLGLVGWRLVPGLDDPEQLLPRMAERHLSTLVYVLFAGALISAILSTVDSTLLVASSLFSRNLVLAGRKGLSEKTRLRVARGGVVLFGIVAWALAHGGKGVFSLVEQASGFGSAGILVVVVFGLFTRFGGARSAFASLVSGIAVWVWMRYFADGFEYPYLASLGAALAAFVAVATFETAPAAVRPQA